MKILVLNGSPRGDQSVTYHHVLFLEKHFRVHDFQYIEIGQALLEDRDLEEAIGKMLDAHLIFWSFPVYNFSVPFQLMNFINRLNRLDIADQLKGKATCQLSTSKHLMDISAHKYMESCLNDLGMNHLGSHTAGMKDLLSDQGRKQMVSFFMSVEHLLEAEYMASLVTKQETLTYPFAYEPIPEPDKLDGNVSSSIMDKHIQTPLSI